MQLEEDGLSPQELADLERELSEAPPEDEVDGGEEAPPEAETEGEDLSGAEAEEPTPEEVEAEARALGWKPPEELGRTPKNGAIEDPAEWIRLHRQNVPVLTAANRRLEEELRKLRRDVDAEVERKVGRALEIANKAIERQRAQLDGDWQRYIAAAESPEESWQRQRDHRDAMAAFDAQAKPKDEAPPVDPNAPTEDDKRVFAEWASKQGEWFGPHGIKDRELAGIWQVIVGDPAVSHLSLSELLDHGAAEIRKTARWRELHPGRKPPGASPVAQNGARTPSARPKDPVLKLSADDVSQFNILFRPDSEGKGGRSGAYPGKTKAEAMREFAKDIEEMT